MNIDLLLIVLSLICFVLVILMALWINHLARTINAMNGRLQALEMRAMHDARDPVTNFKTL